MHPIAQNPAYDDEDANAVADQVVPFLFERLDLRGAWVRLDKTWEDLNRARAYPAPVARLFGEMSAVTALIAANLKQPGRMTFQLRNEAAPEAAAITLLVLDCDEQLRMRGMARWQGDIAAAAPSDAALLGQGHLLLSLDAAGMRQPYQSLVPLEGERIGDIFEHYLSLSEQTPTRLALAANAGAAAGLYLQKLPGADTLDADGWNRVLHQLATLRDEELLTLPAATLLRRLFPEDDLRLYAPRAVRHHCPEDAEKIKAMLLGLGRAECEAALAEHGELHVRDELCNRDYRFNAEQLAAVFDGRTLH